jgi:hypothetical protein
MQHKMKIKNGMTIIEVMVSIGIFTIGMVGFTLLFARSWQSNHFILEKGQASFLASRQVDLMVGDLRRVRQPDNGEYPVKSCDDFDLVVFLDIDKDNVTEKVHYYLDGEQIKRGVSNPSGTPPVYPSGDQETLVLTNYVTNEADEPVFEYYNHDYPGDVANNPLDTPVNDLEDVRLVKIHLRINIDPIRAPENVTVESFAEMRNLNDYH